MEGSKKYELMGLRNLETKRQKVKFNPQMAKKPPNWGASQIHQVKMGFKRNQRE